MLKAIIEELSKVYPCYSMESFDAKSATLENFFFVVDFGVKQDFGRFSHKALFVYIYSPRQSFYMLKELKKDVWRRLHKKKFAKKEEEGNFWVEFIKEAFSKLDKTLNKRCTCMEFRVPAV